MTERKSSKQLIMRDVMHAIPHTVGAEQPLAVAKELMTKYGIRHLPVRSLGRIVGILSDRDVNFAIAVDGQKAENIQVKDACSQEPYTVAPTQQLSEVAAQMSESRLGCVLIMEGDNLLGIFTTVDACRVLSELLHS